MMDFECPVCPAHPKKAKIRGLGGSFRRFLLIFSTFFFLRGWIDGDFEKKDKFPRKVKVSITAVSQVHLCLGLA